MFTLGIDVGGTKIAAGLVTFPGGAVSARRVIPTHAQRGGAAVLEDVLRLAAELASEARARNQPIQAIGIGVCELVDRAGRIVSGHTIDWRRCDVRRRLGRIAPTFLEADVRAAAFGEARFGAGRRFRSFLYVTVGTGISCSLVIDGQPWPGARGFNGTMASSPLQHVCPDCAHRDPRTLEQIAAGPALRARFNAESRKSAVSAEEVLAAARAGDTHAKSVVKSAGDALGRAVGHLVNVLDPEAVVLGGGLGLAKGLYRDRLVAAARRQIWSDLHRDLPIVSAALSADAGIIGAAVAACEPGVGRGQPGPGTRPSTSGSVRADLRRT